MLSPDELAALKERHPCDDIAGKWVKLRRKGKRRIGPCPICGGEKGSARFEASADGWVCAVCADGGDVIKLVQRVENLDFRAAVEWLGGAAAVDGEQAKRLAAARAARDAKRAADSGFYREQERGTLYGIWRNAVAAQGTAVATYLAGRGLEIPDGAPIRCVPDMPYFAHGGKDAAVLARGPAMVVPIVRPDGRFGGLHFTYLDQAARKVELADPETGEAMPAKKVRGSKAGNLIKLVTPATATRAVIGEGIETVLSVWAALLMAGRDLSTTAFWSAVDLGNLGGRAESTIAHPTAKDARGRPRRPPGPDADMASPAIAVPDGIADVVLLGDGDSDQVLTMCAIYRATTRLAREGRSVTTAWAPAGRDFNDMLRAGEPERIVALVAGARPQARPVFAEPVAAPTMHGAAARVALAQRAQDEAGAIAAAAHQAEPQRSDSDRPIDASGRPEPAGPSEPASPSVWAQPLAVAAAPAADEPPWEGIGEWNDDFPSDDLESDGLDAPPPAAAAAAPPPSSAAVEKTQPSQMGGSEERAQEGAAKDGRRGSGRAATERRIARTDNPGAVPEALRRGGDIDVAALDKRLAFFPLTDLGNAERFRERNRGYLVWCDVIGWLWWDGRRWAREGAADKVRIAAHMTVRSIQDEADAIVGTPADTQIGEKGPKGDKHAVMYSHLLREFGRDSESNSKLNQIAEQAAAYLAVRPAALDADPFAINVRNGTLLIGREHDGYVRFKPHDPADLITKIAPVDYDPAATCPRFDQFIVEVQPSPDMRRTLQQWSGYRFTGDTSEQKLAMFYGKGKNGKSVFEETCAGVQGDYSSTTPIETFLAEGRGRNAGQATPDLAVLPGVRMLRTSEPKKGARLDEGLIKLVTGGEVIKARHLNLGYFEFYPAFKLTISGNYRPAIGGTDEGIWRRIVLVPWTVTVGSPGSDLKTDPQLAAKLRGEAPGILNWMLDGLRDWLDNGLKVAREAEEATAEYRRDSDQLGRFLEACTLPSPGDRVQSSVLHDVFNKWSAANSLNPWKGRGFSDAMTERGFKKDKSSVVFFLDVKLIKTAADFTDHEGNPVVMDDGRHDEPAGDDMEVTF